MRKPNRINLGLLDDEVLALINASAKIFPITQEMVDNNLNPDNFEYARIGNHIYRWSEGAWEYIIADDVEIYYDELLGVPTQFPPAPHGHIELHTHDNKAILDTIASDDMDVWDTVVNKASKNYVDEELSKKSDTTHDHDERYAGKSVEDIVADIGLRLYNIENGYTEGHSHPNITLLNNITELNIAQYNTVVDKADKTYVDTELSKKAASSTMQGHIDNSTIHVTQTQVDKWDAKVDVEDLPAGYTVSVDKPTDGSMWYKIVG